MQQNKTNVSKKSSRQYSYLATIGLQLAKRNHFTEHKTAFCTLYIVPNT